MKALIALDVDGTLIDTTASFNRIVHEVAGLTDEEMALFRRTGGFNDDWELARAGVAWVAAGRPRIVERVEDWRDLVAWCGHDPGDLSAQCIALYRGGYWRDERTLVDGALLSRLAARHSVAACTGRDAWELDRAQELLGFTFPRATTMEHHKKPDPRALSRLRTDEDVVVLFGDTEADRRCAQRYAREAPQVRVGFFEAARDRPVRPALERLLDAADADAVLAGCERW